MTVKVKKWRRNGMEGWEIDIRVTLPDGTRLPRKRVKSPVSSRSGSLRWGQQLEAQVIARGGRKEEERAPAVTLEAFWPRFMEGHARANQEKPSNLDTRERIYRRHLAPLLGDLALDEIDDEHVQRLKGRLSKMKPKTVNNVLTTLNKLLKVSVEWRVLAAMPCRIRLLKTAKPVVEFYEEPEYQRLVTAAEQVDPRAHLVVLLGGDAGLRLGEILGLEWTDLDLARRLIKVQRGIYDDGPVPVVTLPKGGKPRIIPMTGRLKDALAAHRHLRGERVLYQEDGEPQGKWSVKWLIDRAERRAGLRPGGRVHILRHTFCSRLAARNVPMLSIKELAGHQSLETTQRYMHLSSAAPREAIRTLETQVGGAVGEPDQSGERNSSENN
jgi:integrase